jgi:serine/threonine protein kinase
VKTCQYSFPKGEKISAGLKDLIEKIFVINYDDRLTLEQIMAHPFFEGGAEKEGKGKGSQSEAKGFAVLRNMFSRDKERKPEKEEAKRSNSCETFKQIKEIFKNKSRGTLMTSMGTEFKTEENLGNSAITITQSTRERASFGGVSLRSVGESSFGGGLISKRL